ncbi:MAG: hypothetical protein N2748_06555, partial [candidate division WOR-3 bacterium]|nr:hypothetical protein [candidate division WOR-3 bacterium]
LKHRVKLICSDLFANIADHKPADLIIGNLPYLPENEIDDLPLTILKYEPVVALNGGKDGFALIAKVIQQSARYLKPDGFLALEIDPRQARLITEIKQVNSQIATADFEYDNNSLIRYAFIKYHNR